MTAPLDLDALKAKALAATPGQWMHLFGDRTVYDRMEDGCRGNAIVRSDCSPPTPQEAADLDHIAAASPAVMLELLARLERAEANASQSARGAAPVPVYDPSLHVPAEIVEAANTVSTWAAKQDRGEWRIGNVCSPDFGRKEMDRLRSNVDILRAQAMALHAVGHAIGVPAGEEVTKAVLPAVKALVERAARAETIANSVLESITSQPNTVMVMNSGQAEDVVGVAAELARIIPAKSTVIVLQDGATLEQLNQDDMRRHGWVRAEGGAQ